MSVHPEGFEDGWADRFLSRRSVLRGGLLGGAGLAAAALIGCGDDDDDDDDDATPAGGGAATATATSAGGEATAMPATGGIKRGGTFVQSNTNSISDIPDPHTSLAYAWFTWTLVGEGLVKWANDASAVEPILLEGWEVAPDGLELVMNVREGVKWQNLPPVNGRAFDAEDVAYNLNRIAGFLNLPEDEGKVLHRKSGLAGMTEAVAVDANNVRVSFEAPTSPFMAGLTNGRNSMVPREFPGDVAFEYNTVVGTGAFILDKYSNEETAIFRANPDYWREGQPYLDEYEWVWVPDAVTQRVAFAQGEIDFISGSTPGARADVENLSKDAVLQTWPFNSWAHLRFNVGIRPFDDPRVRKALQRVVDVKAIGDAQVGEGFYQFTGPLASGFADAIQPAELATLPGWRADKEADIAEAMKLMAAAGFPDGAIDFPMLASAGTTATEIPIRVTDQWRSVWPDLNVTIDQTADSASFGRRQGEGDFDMVSYGIFAEGDAQLELQSQYGTGGGRNYAKFSDARTDELLEKALHEIDIEERRETLIELQHYLIEEHLSIITMYITFAAWYQQPWVRGFEPTGPSGGNGSFDYGREAYKIWLDK